MTNTTNFIIHGLDDSEYFIVCSFFLGLCLFCIILVDKTEQDSLQNQEIQIL